MGVAAALEQVPAQVKLVQALHDDDLNSGFGVVEAEAEGSVVPVEHACSGGVAECFFDLVRVVDDDYVATFAGAFAADAVAVENGYTGERFRIAVDRADALDAFHHPYAYDRRRDGHHGIGSPIPSERAA